MPLDPSIILGAGQGVTPLNNPVDVMSKGLQFQNLAMANTQQKQEFQDNQAMRNAMNNHTSIDENGNPSIDRAGIMKELGQTSPSTVMKAAQGFAQMDLAMQKQRMESASEKLDFAGKILGGVSDQKSYENAMKQAQSVGADTSQWPEQYDPKFVQYSQQKALNTKDQIDLQIKQQDVQNKKRDLDIQTFKTFGAGGMPGGSSGGTPNPPGYIPPQKPGQNAQLSPVDPATLINRAPQDQKAALTKEISHASNVAAVAKPLIETHDAMVQAAKDNKIGEYMGLKNHYTQLVRTANQDITDNNSREATIEGIVKSTAPGLEAKLSGDYSNSQKAVRDWVGLEKASPTATNAGIDLNKFSKTHIDPSLLVMPGDKSPSIQQSQKYIPSKSEAAAELARRQAARQSQASK